MLVIDASALVIAAVDQGDRGRGIRRLMYDGAAAPHLVDAEVGQAIRGLVLRRLLAPEAGLRSLEAAHGYVTHRYDHLGYLARAWELRDNVSFYDGLYVALAEASGLALVTADRRLAAAAGSRCDVQRV